jgi:hypothetical protein
MWPPKRWEIESGHIRISSWVQGERRRRRRILYIPATDTKQKTFFYYNKIMDTVNISPHGNLQLKKAPPAAAETEQKRLTPK